MNTSSNEPFFLKATGFITVANSLSELLVGKEFNRCLLDAPSSLIVRGVMKPYTGIHIYVCTLTVFIPMEEAEGFSGWGSQDELKWRKIWMCSQENICKWICVGLRTGLPVGEEQGWKPHDFSHFKVARTKPLGLYSMENPAVSGVSGWTKWPSVIGLFHPWFQWVSENP